MVLVVVLVVISLLSLSALTFSQLMTAEHEAAELAGRQIQARALAESGQEAIRMFLGMEPQNQLDAGGWFDNPDVFQGVLVVDAEQPRKRGRFTVLAPLLDQGLPSGVRYGLENDSARLNLNAVLQADESGENGGRNLLMALPGMNEEIADCILDWLDEDDEPREFGAEIDTYSSLDPAYAPKNGPLEAIEELLLVEGVTPWLLFGVDANRNGYTDTTEPDPQSLEDVDNSDGSMDGGWAAYLTLHSAENPTRPDGTPKIDLNQDDLQTLYNELMEVFEQDWVNYIIAYRQDGSGGGQTKDQLSGSLNLTVDPQQEIESVLDLIGGRATAIVQGQQNSEVLNSPFSEDPASMSSYLPELMENVQATQYESRVNINQAPRVVLACIPGLSIDLVDQILARRQEDPLAAESDPLLACEAWPLLDGIVDLETMKNLAPYVTTGGSVYRAQVVGYFDEGGPAARVEVIVDATQSPASIVSWKELSHLGRGYSLDVLGVEATGY